MYQTIVAEVNIFQPAETVGMSPEHIVKFCRENWDFEDDAEGRPHPVGEAAEYMEAIAEVIFDPEDWRNPFVAVAPAFGTNWTIAATNWYHGDDPIVEVFTVFGNGYQCW